jgi:hypothetical protein
MSTNEWKMCCITRGRPFDYVPEIHEIFETLTFVSTLKMILHDYA